jgi:hypothetical protein
VVAPLARPIAVAGDRARRRVKSGERQRPRAEKLPNGSKTGVIAVPLVCDCAGSVAVRHGARVADGWLGFIVMGGIRRRSAADFMLGHSSGAHLKALLAVIAVWTPAVQRSTAVCSPSRALDLRDPEAARLSGPAWRILFGAGEELLRRLSPVLYVLEGKPRFFTNVGDDLIHRNIPSAWSGRCARCRLVHRRGHCPPKTQTIFQKLTNPGEARRRKSCVYQ